jgi:hypothetical protein
MIVASQAKGKAKEEEGSSKGRVLETSQEVVIFSSHPQEEEFISGQLRPLEISISKNPIEEPKHYVSLEEYVHIRQDNMSGVEGLFEGEKEEERRTGGGEN